MRYSYDIIFVIIYSLVWLLSFLNLRIPYIYEELFPPCNIEISQIHLYANINLFMSLELKMMV